MIIKLSRKFKTLEQLENLAVMGLGLDEGVVCGYLSDYSGEIHSAAKAVFKEWREKQYNRKIAFAKMCKGLKDNDVGLNYLVYEILLA